MRAFSHSQLGKTVLAPQARIVWGVAVAITIVWWLFASPVTGSRPNESVANLYEMGVKLQEYCLDHGGKLPPLRNPGDVQAALSTYIKPEMLRTPDTHEPYLVNPTLSGRSMDSIRSPGSTVVFYEPHDRHGRRLVEMVDRHIKYLTAEEWAQAKKGL